MTVVPFKRPPAAPAKKASRPGGPGNAGRRSLLEFLVAMAMTGLILFLLPSLWPGAPTALLAVINLLVAAAYVQLGPRLVAIGWIALSLVLLALAGAPSPASYALSQGLALIGGP